ncbi:hypothetical protein [Shewanella sp. Isolate11]|uniref:hypothetical protein n=1 Tax=Shewanella sp. Isolate11 TaxID=2908530 RepID=UPI001EFD5D61|nr:hypothetical protein [Shewanella sp. Isolate11]MCG9697586.1 hypothetical protein [Shewanella sp. Isolate11]
MLDAVCRLEGEEAVTYSVFKFQAFDEAEIERLRQHLFCPACDGKAYFRKASRDGKAACFGSRYHQLDCGEFKPSLSRQQEEQDAVEVNQLLLDSEALVIDFARRPRNRKNHQVNTKEQQAKVQQVETPKAVYQAEPQTDIQADTQAYTQLPMQTTDTAKFVSDKLADKTSDKPSDKRVGSEGLEKLLNSLLRGSDLASSDLWVYTDAKYRWRAKNLFVNFKDAQPTENGAPRMYWGTISHCDKSMQWLNPADCKDVGIPIDAVQAKLQQRFGIDSRRDLEGAGIIIFGKCFWNKDKTRKIIQLWNRDISRMHISVAEEDE